MPVVVGQVGRVYWSSTSGDPNDNWNEFLAFLESGLKKQLALGANLLTMTIVVPGAMMPSSTSRKKLAELVAKYPETVTAHAVVSSSPLVRGTLTALGWLFTKTYKEQTFHTPEAAVRWLAAQSEGVDVPAVLADLMSKTAHRPATGS